MVNRQDVISVSITQELRDRATAFSDRKIGHTRNTWEEREIEEKSADIIMGDISKEALKQYLNEHNIDYQDYDEVRTDDFREPAPWNLRIQDNEHENSVELKSSLVRYLGNIDRVLDEFNILAYPDQVSSIYVQAAFIRRFSVGDNCYLVGWLSRDEIAVDANLGRLPNHPYHVDYYYTSLRNTNPMAELEVVPAD